MPYLYVYPCVSRMVIVVIQTIIYLLKVLNHVDSEPVVSSAFLPPVSIFHPRQLLSDSKTLKTYERKMRDTHVTDIGLRNLAVTPPSVSKHR